MHGGAHPERAHRGGGGEHTTKGLELRGGSQTIAHKLDFVHNPKAIIVEQTELYRPAESAKRITTVERAGKKHVLGSDQYGVAFRIHIPIPVNLAAHE